MNTSPATPLEVVANVSRVVTRVVDRVTGDRSNYPLLVCIACVHALRGHGITAQVIFGKAAWIEVLPDHELRWVGCWSESVHLWVETQHGEVVDLNASVSFRRRTDGMRATDALRSPPILWSSEIPRFYRYAGEGLAQADLLEDRDRRWLDTCLREISEKCGTSQIEGKEAEFPNEPILCPGRRVLDDSESSFRHFERALGVRGIPAAPF